MTWTYSGDPSSNDRDTVRFLVGDTDTTNQIVSDEEIAWALAQESVYSAAATVCDAISAKYARDVDTYLDRDVRANLSQASRAYASKARELRVKARSKIAVPYCGGISSSVKTTYEQDSDRVIPSFKVSQHEYN